MPVHLGGHLDDVRELVRVQARPAHQRTVTQRQLDVLLHVLRIHASSLKDAHLARRPRSDHPPHHAPGEPHGRLLVLRVRVLPLPYGPPRLSMAARPSPSSAGTATGWAPSTPEGVARPGTRAARGALAGPSGCPAAGRVCRRCWSGSSSSCRPRAACLAVSMMLALLSISRGLAAICP